jgi:hypothetical protein
MRKGVVANVKAVDRQRLAAIVANRNSPQKDVSETGIRMTAVANEEAAASTEGKK